MSRAWHTALLLAAAAGCDEAPIAAPPATAVNDAANDATPADAAPPTPPAPPSRQIGTVSNLSAQTSALTGVVSGFQVTRSDAETRVSLAADTLFDFDQATLTRAAEANLGRTAELVAAGGTGVVRVIGHTDAKGDDAYNDALSKRRADAVAAWLRARPALARRSFETVGRGKREPIAPNTAADGRDDPQGRARNRRVEVIIPR